MRVTRNYRIGSKRVALVAFVALVGAACSASPAVENTPPSVAEDVPTQEIQYSYLPGTNSLEWIRDTSNVIVVGTLVEIRSEAFSRYGPESMDDIERVYQGLVFEPAEWFKGDASTPEIVVLDPVMDRHKDTKKKTSFLVSAAYPVSEKDVGETFALFLVYDAYAPDMFAFTSMRYGAVLVRDDGTFKVHRPQDEDNPWLGYKNEDWDQAFVDLGLVDS